MYYIQWNNRRTRITTLIVSIGVWEKSWCCWNDGIYMEKKCAPISTCNRSSHSRIISETKLVRIFWLQGDVLISIICVNLSTRFQFWSVRRPSNNGPIFSWVWIEVVSCSIVQFFSGNLSMRQGLEVDLQEESCINPWLQINSCFVGSQGYSGWQCFSQSFGPIFTFIIVR